MPVNWPCALCVRFARGCGGDHSWCMCRCPLCGTRTPYNFASSIAHAQNATFTNAIVGGTGIFNGASGSVNVTVLEAGSRWRYNVQLLQKPNCTSS